MQDVAGDEGIQFCRSILDGDSASSGDRDSAHLHNLIQEGRCVVCNQSTFAEDMLQQKEQQQKDQMRAARLSTGSGNGNGNGCGGSDDEGEEGVASGAGGAVATVANMEEEVILCDGCNAEVHLKCLNLSSVSTFLLLLLLLGCLLKSIMHHAAFFSVLFSPFFFLSLSC
jgi:hypothetical protein